jgi:error-prone DNA polymerase
MGFYSPHSLVQDARRHGVEVRTPDLNASDWNATLERDSRGNNPADLSPIASSWTTWGHGGPAVRLGIGSVRGIGDDLAKEIAAGRPYESMEDLERRVPSLTLPHLEALATAGAFGCFDVSRRAALWGAGAVAQSRPDRLAGIVTGVDAPSLPGMSPREEAIADLWATGVSPDGHPTRFVRDHLDALGAIRASGLAAVDAGEKVLVGGVVTHRQRPATAQGTIFINLEDETGLINVVCSKGCWTRYRRVARGCPALLIRGRLEKHEGVINVVAERIDALPLDGALRSRDFR